MSNSLPDGYTFRRFSMPDIRRALNNWYNCDDCTIEHGHDLRTYIVTLHYFFMNTDVFDLDYTTRFMRVSTYEDLKWLNCAGTITKTTTINEEELFGIAIHGCRSRIVQN